MAMDFDEALDYFWNMTKKQRDAVDTDELTGKEHSALMNIKAALDDRDAAMLKFITERTIGRAQQKKDAIEQEYENLAEDLKNFLRGES